jgi:hypothetical protein
MGLTATEVFSRGFKGTRVVAPIARGIKTNKSSCDMSDCVCHCEDDGEDLPSWD